VIAIALVYPSAARFLGPIHLSCYSYAYGCGTPTVTSIYPTAGPTTGGTTVTINGTNFNNSGLTVHFGATQSPSVTFVSDVQIRAASPAGAAATVHITVTTAAGTSTTSAADQFTFTAAAWCASFDMSAVPTTWVVGQAQTFSVKTTNCGSSTWVSTGYNEIDLDLHFATSSGGSANQANWTSSLANALGADVAPNSSATVSFTISAPAGSTVLEALMIREHSFWFDQMTSSPQQWNAVTITLVAAKWSGMIDMSTAPANWVTGQSQTFSIHVTNTGNVTWISTGYNEIDLDLHFATSQGGSATQVTWTSSMANALGADVPPNGSATVSFTLTAPAGSTVLEGLMIKEHAFWFDQVTSSPQQWAPKTVTVAAPKWSGTVDMSSIPQMWKAGESKAFTVMVTNSGNVTWPHTGYNEVDLDFHFATSAGGSANQANWVTSQAFALPSDVLPGGSVTVTGTLTAPDHPGGSLTLESLMIKEHQFWFDAVTASPQQWGPIFASVTQATYVVTGVPAAWTKGQTQTFTVTVTNNTAFTWAHTGYNEFDLDLHFTTTTGGSAQQASWLTSQAFALPADLAPGASAVVTVTITAPNTAGSMFVEAEMIKEHAWWFTDVNSKAVVVT
jgi:hypothetical protein